VLSYNAYKLIHLIFILLLFFSLGAYLILSRMGTLRARRLAAITHGISTVIILVSGFGLIAKLGIGSFESWPAWLWVKLAVWLLLALVMAVIKRVPSLTAVLWFVIPALGALAVFMVIYKPIF